VICERKGAVVVVDIYGGASAAARCAGWVSSRAKPRPPVTVSWWAPTWQRQRRGDGNGNGNGNGMGTGGWGARQRGGWMVIK
jgi:hypothetical protein